VKDRGGSTVHTDRLKDAITKEQGKTLDQFGLGLEIVKMLSESIVLSVDENNVTSIHVVRKREESSPAD